MSENGGTQLGAEDKATQGSYPGTSPLHTYSVDTASVQRKAVARDESPVGPYGDDGTEGALYATQPDTSYPVKSFLPHICLAAIAIVSIIALAAMAYAPGTETSFIQNTLGVIAVGATTGLAGIVKGPGT